MSNDVARPEKFSAMRLSRSSATPHDRLLQRREDGVVEEPADDGADDDAEDGEEDAAAQLDQMCSQRHPAAGFTPAACVHLRVRPSAGRCPRSALAGRTGVHDWASARGGTTGGAPTA